MESNIIETGPSTHQIASTYLHQSHFYLPQVPIISPLILPLTYSDQFINLSFTEANNPTNPRVFGMQDERGAHIQNQCSHRESMKTSYRHNTRGQDWTGITGAGTQQFHWLNYNAASVMSGSVILLFMHSPVLQLKDLLVHLSKIMKKIRSIYSIEGCWNVAG